MRELSVFSAADEVPHRDCLIEGERAHSFSEVAMRVGAALERLKALGVEPGSVVALTPRAELDSVVWLYALFEVGATALLLHPRITPRGRELILAGAPPHRSLEDEAPVAVARRPTERFEASPEDALAIVYTSGTTAMPRGAVLSRRAFLASAKAHAAHLGWRHEDRWLLAIPPAHIGGLSILTRSLIARRCVVMSPGGFEPVALQARMARHRVTLLSVVPTMLRRLVARDWRPHPELRAVLVGGATFSKALQARAVELGIPALATYGCTETCSQVATQSLDQIGTHGSGCSLRGIDVRIRDGEVQVRGEVVMDGYVGEPRSPNTWTDDGWLRTGDEGELDAGGRLLVHGRRDDLIISGGENVSPAEVEAWLESVPGVVSACVFAITDEEWGAAVAAALIVDSVTFDRSALADRACRELAGHKRPKQVALLDALPLNRAGKVDRRATADRAHALLRPI